MIRKTIITASLALAGIAASGSANAELISVEDGLAVYDSETSTFWMNLRETAGLPLATLQSEMEEGGQYEGWRFASADEVYELWSLNVAGYDENKHLSAYYISRETKADWISFFKSTEDRNSSAFYFDGTNWRLGGVFRDDYPRAGEDVFFTESRTGPYNNFANVGYDYHGHYMIYGGTFSLGESVASAEDVPLPLWGMGALGLLCLGFGRNKKTA